MDLVFLLHSPEIGLEHDNLNASHILDFEGKPIFIDFGAAEPHECLAWEEAEAGQLTRETLPVKEGDVLGPRGPRTVMCYELWYFLEFTKYCLPCEIEYDGTTFGCSSITSAGVLYERAVIRFPKFRSAKEMWDEAVEKWKVVRSHWKKYHPDAVVEPPLGI
ncbi:hypothetical protein C0992_007711, partial [Termitomyces sp. T32_za158]